MFATNTKDNITADVKAGASRVGNDIRQTAKNVQGDLRSASNQASSTLDSVAYDLGQKVHDYVDSASRELNDVSDRVTFQIRTNPVQSTLVAAAIGFLFGLALRR